ncbi:MAG: hypothetical protein WD043_07300 [Gemmatimonadales bacterium]
MTAVRRRFVGTLLGLLFVLALGFGAREAIASARMSDCEDCDGTTNCDRCCEDWNMGTTGICPFMGGVCLCS